MTRLVLHGGLAGEDGDEDAALRGLLGARRPARVRVGLLTGADPAPALKAARLYRRLGVADVALVTDRDPGPLLDAVDLVHLPGGSAPLLARALRDARVARALREARARGALIVAESAGAMALGVRAFGCPHEDAEGAAACAGLGWLPTAVVEAHYEEPVRRRRLAGVLERGEAGLGLGIDGATALVLEAGRAAAVLGVGAVHLMRKIGGELHCRAARSGEWLPAVAGMLGPPAVPPTPPSP